MGVLFIQYPKCSTCIKAKKWLQENGIEFEDRHIVEQTPTVEELKKYVAQSGQPLKKFFNTSGMKYKALNLKEKLPQMPEEAQYELLAGDGMLIKRPILAGDDFVLTGFKEAQWKEKLGI